ncbi:sn-glycerol-3-phosphate ABC transporter ATP-binding protein UgpC [Bradyrhizobium sp.]|jgi:multiple sugar transport system ATP-binding protein|uniref:ABC transporter ATP-binding protein n=1 Tax=Bradyrhizobium sp. TaxID=376 RepID=UPI002BB62E53|nr:sn-glycerol-3-phosphate ABC transporter ATP-binding protein UgpC [Bradyrhizobium sp.]HWX63796.1 sn-glycerol-3-phosphate ABC transporter ATP-binding protein UgpC [Bradyrhizobium sp.]
MATLTIKSVHKRFGPVEVLKGIDIEARDGEFVALVGPSGCGKSTLLAMIAGLETVTSGQIFIDERLVNSVAPKDRDIAMVFQSYALYPTMTARANITFGMESRGVPRKDQDEQVARVAQLLQIEPLLHRKPGQLSGGQRQRVAMGRALVRNPKLFLFDEPLSNLDAKLRVDMRTEIKKLHQRVGKTTIYVTHDQVEAMTLASRIAVMHQGSVQQFDIPQRVYARPANMFVAGFMGSPSMNFLQGTLSSRDGAPCVEIPLANGGTAAMPLARPPGIMPVGGKVVLGIRPEHLYRYDADLKAKKPTLARLTAPVELVEPTGAETVANLRIGDCEVVGRFDPDGAPEAGEQLDLGIDMAPACLFDPNTQKLIPDASS